MAMMVLRPKVDFSVTVEAEITPELAAMSVEEAAKFRVYYGREQVALGELFEITKEGDEKKLVLEGDFSRVKWVGARMEDGEIVVKGSIGAHCGAYMKGGRIEIQGDADDWLGAEMTGGEIIVKGNARNLVGCAYYGDMKGMSGGRILIEGNAGNYIGEKMAGGEIEIKGDAGDFIGTEMTNGIITIHGGCGFAGGDMKGGEIRIGGEFDLLPSFRKSDEGFIGDINVGGKGVIKQI